MRGVDYPPAPNAEIKERVELQAYFNYIYVPPTACYGVTLARRYTPEIIFAVSVLRTSNLTRAID